MGRKILGKLALATGSLLVVGAVSELVARAMEPGKFSLWDSRPYDHHPTLLHVHKPNFGGRWDGTWYGINSLGMRGPEITPKPAPNEYRVVAVGDSCTFGKGVREEDSWPRQLEALLDGALSPERDAIVANLGVNGFSGVHYLRIFEERGVRLEPDLVIVGYNLNDFPNIIRAVDRQLYKGAKGAKEIVPKAWRDAIARLAIVRLARSTYYDLGRKKAYLRAEQLAGQVKDNDFAAALAKQEEYLEGPRKECARCGRTGGSVPLPVRESGVPGGIRRESNHPPARDVRSSRCCLRGLGRGVPQLRALRGRGRLPAPVPAG